MRKVRVARCEVCGKRRYATREAAEMALARVRIVRAAGEQYVYLLHDWWHTTSQPQRRKR